VALVDERGCSTPLRGHPAATSVPRWRDSSMAEGRGQATCDRECHPDRRSIAVVSSAHPPWSRPGLQDARQRHRDASRGLRSFAACGLLHRRARSMSSPTSKPPDSRVGPSPRLCWKAEWHSSREPNSVPTARAVCAWHLPSQPGTSTARSSAWTRSCAHSGQHQDPPRRTLAAPAGPPVAWDAERQATGPERTARG
jgi:hypothetical protein